MEESGSDKASHVVNVMHTQSFHENRQGVFKIEMASVEDKIDVLRKKKNLKSLQYFNRVFLRSSQSQLERLMHTNFG